MLERTPAARATNSASYRPSTAETVRPLIAARIDEAEPSATTEPLSIITTRSANWSASSM
ncbi:hypothetical protein ACFQ0M_25985 [Kitasatospora aburaviensis]